MIQQYIVPGFYCKIEGCHFTKPSLRHSHTAINYLLLIYFIIGSIVYHINVVLNLFSFVYCFFDTGKHLFSLQFVSQVYN